VSNIRSVEHGLSRGVAPRMSPYADATHYNGDGHAQRFVREGELQMVMSGRIVGADRGPGGNGSSYGCGSRR
jgi:hypothetical protein